MPVSLLVTLFAARAPENLLPVVLLLTSAHLAVIGFAFVAMNCSEFETAFRGRSTRNFNDLIGIDYMPEDQIRLGLFRDDFSYSFERYGTDVFAFSGAAIKRAAKRRLNRMNASDPMEPTAMTELHGDQVMQLLFDWEAVPQRLCTRLFERLRVEEIR